MDSYPVSFRLANKIYENNFRLYRRLYFMYKQVSDRQLIERVKDSITPGMIVLDIGGNIGFYTRLFSSLVGAHGHVYAFEPERQNFEHLASGCVKLENVTLVQKAVGERTKSTFLYQSPELNVDHQTYDIGESRSSVEIQCISIDDFFQGSETIDFIKIDIQGYDYFALQGMRDTIARSGNVTLMGELWPYGLLRAGVEPLDYLKLIGELGFDIELPRDVNRGNLQRMAEDKFFYTSFWAERVEPDTRADLASAEEPLREAALG